MFYFEAFNFFQAAKLSQIFKTFSTCQPALLDHAINTSFKIT